MIFVEKNWYKSLKKINIVWQNAVFQMLGHVVYTYITVL